MHGNHLPILLEIQSHDPRSNFINGVPAEFSLASLRNSKKLMSSFSGEAFPRCLSESTVVSVSLTIHPLSPSHGQETAISL